QPTEIIQDFLYLSGVYTAANGDLLASNNITHVINISPCTNFYETKVPKSILKKLYVHDEPGENIKKFFDVSNKFIYKAKETRGRVLIHCWAGRSRSVSLILAFLMDLYKYSFNEAFNYVKAKRSIIKPNRGFRLQLSDYEAELNGSLEVSVS
ncbi:dual specificity phosphatase, partial [Glomus cerebriforme]